MDEGLGSRIRKTATEMAERLNEAAQQAGERLNEWQESARLALEIRRRQREVARRRAGIADTVIRMFDQQDFAVDQLRPGYTRIKVLQAEIARLEEERRLLGEQAATTAGPDQQAERST